MPPELFLNRRYSRSEVIGCLVVVVFWIGIGSFFHWACLVTNPVYLDAPIAKKISMVVFIDGIMFCFMLLSIFGTIHNYYYRLIFDENGITEHGIWSVKNIRISEITGIRWRTSGGNTNGPNIQLRTLTTRITIGLNFLRHDKKLQSALVVFLRESVPHERQTGWKPFCYRMEKPLRWKEKNAVADPNKGEILYTRKMFNRTIIVPMIGSVIIWSGFGYLVHFIHKWGCTMDDLPQGILGSFIACFCVLWVGWLFRRFCIPKSGKILKMKYLLYGNCFLVVFMLTWGCLPFYMLFLVSIPKSDACVEYWKPLIVYTIMMIPLLPIFWLGHQQQKDTRQDIESLPDDYMPTIFVKPDEGE